MPKKKEKKITKSKKKTTKKVKPTSNKKKKLVKSKEKTTEDKKSGQLIARIEFDEEPLSPLNQYKARAIKRGGRAFAMMYMPAKFQKYKDSYMQSARSQYNGEIYDGTVSVKATFFLSTLRKKDLPNAGKLEFDALNGIVYTDDSQICKLETEKIYRKNEPGSIIEIYSYPEAQWD